LSRSMDGGRGAVPFFSAKGRKKNTTSEKLTKGSTLVEKGKTRAKNPTYCGNRTRYTRETNKYGGFTGVPQKKNRKNKKFRKIPTAAVPAATQRSNLEGEGDRRGKNERYKSVHYLALLVRSVKE